MIDALLNVAVFAVLVLCIFGANWAHKRVRERAEAHAAFLESKLV